MRQPQASATTMGRRTLPLTLGSILRMAAPRNPGTQGPMKPIKRPKKNENVRAGGDRYPRGRATQSLPSATGRNHTFPAKESPDQLKTPVLPVQMRIAPPAPPR